MVDTQKKIPKWLSYCLKPQDQEQIEAAVRAIEAKTTGEIVPMIVRRSCAAGHVRLQVSTLVLLIYFAGGGSALTRDYGGYGLLWTVGEILVLVAASFLMARLTFICRWLTPREDQDKQVYMRAELEFFEANLNKTAGATGVLLFISLFERRAVVLADKNIAVQLPSESWQDVVKLLIGGIKKGELAAGFVDAINKAGELIIPRFPAVEHNPNELGDVLIVKE